MPVAISFHAKYGISLPEASKKMKINLMYEFRSDKDSAFLMYNTFNNKTTPLQAIRIPLPPTLKKRDTISPFSFMRIEADIPKGANNCIIQFKTQTGIVSLGRCDIEIDGKKIEAYTYDQAPPFSSSELKQIEKKSSNSLKINNQVKVLGIGESIHGSRAFVEQTAKIVKEKITNEGFNTLFLEIPPLLGHHINQYIRGEISNIESVMSLTTQSYNNSYFIDLLNFMR